MSSQIFIVGIVCFFETTQTTCYDLLEAIVKNFSYLNNKKYPHVDCYITVYYGSIVLLTFH